MPGDTIPEVIWNAVLRELNDEGYRFEKAYRVEVTWNEVRVWHDEYDDAGNPVIDSERKLPRVTITRIT